MFLHCHIICTGELKNGIESEVVRVDDYVNNIKIKKGEAKYLRAEIKELMSETERLEKY